MTEEEYTAHRQNLLKERRHNKTSLEAQALSELVPEVIYEMVDAHGRTEEGEAWGTSPDGYGMIWYTTREECENDFPDGGEHLPHVAMTEKDFEAIRYGEDDES